MQYHDFKWKNELASDYGIIVETQAQYIRPAQRLESVVIPGRSGTLTLPDGPAPTWEVVHHAPTCYLKPGADRAAVGRWLSGASEVVFGSMQDRAFLARLVNQIPFTAIEEGLTWMSFSPIFECQPEARRLPEAGDIEVTASGALLQNPGNTEAYPVYRIEGSGDVSLSVAGRQMDITGLTDGIILDFDMMEYTNLTRTALLGKQVSGLPLLLPPGNSALVYTGSITKITITPKWRLL